MWCINELLGETKEQKEGERATEGAGSTSSAKEGQI